ncbi:MAG: FHA domain-containing protein [Actinomycetota bacterium]|nr:FHA domain-containing protein [Actinomycetota bacterium]
MTDTASLTLADGSECRLRDGLTIGRGDENDVALTSTSVSRRHAVVRMSNGRWFIEDRGSANGTFVNAERIGVGVAHPLRHADQVMLGTEILVFSSPAESFDPEKTEVPTPSAEDLGARLSPLQLQVVRCLCSDWLRGSSLDALPTNEQIAAQLGTPGAAGTIKAALRRAYAKAGLSEGAAQAKRRALCRIARQRGWI